MKNAAILPASILCFILMAGTSFATTYYVNDATGNDSWPGVSPEYPKKTIQAGINASANGDTVIVADGTYTGDGNRDIDFKGKSIVLQSENGSADCIIDGTGFSYGAFFFHLSETADSVVDGFTITNAYSTYGGAISCYNSSPTITNCTISNSRAWYGGGIYLYQSEAQIISCVITNNIAGTLSSSGYGAGIYISGGGPTIAHCLIAGNFFLAGGEGGGVYCSSNNTTIFGCVITGNRGRRGGGIYSGSSSITNCLISGNRASGGEGGGIYAVGSGPTITNCTLADNYASNTGGGIQCQESSPTIVNSILWHDVPEEIYTYGSSSPTLDYCNIEGGWSGTGGNNLSVEPLFTSRGYWEDSYWVQGDYHLLGGSPCIDTGTAGSAPSDDIDGEARPQGNDVDIGADEFLDTDGDGLGDWSEQNTFGTDPEDPDCDDDDLNDCQEVITCGTDPLDPDTDNDGMWDGWEVFYGLDPLNDDAGEDIDEDNYTNYHECVAGTNPLDDSSFFNFAYAERESSSQLLSMGTQIKMLWSSVEGKHYVVYYSESEFGAAMLWSLAEDMVPASETGTTMWTDDGSLTGSSPEEVPHRYYRINVYGPHGEKVSTPDIVGLYWMSVDPGRNLASTPLIPYDSSLEKVIGDSLTGSENKYWSDTIEAWDPQQERYYRAWYKPSWNTWIDWDQETPPGFDFEADTSYWINVQVWNDPKDVCFVGKVAHTERSIGVQAGRNLAGLSFPANVGLADSNLVESGFTGNSVKFWSDTVEWWNPVTEDYDRVYYDTDPFDPRWRNWDSTAADRDFLPCEGFWVNVMVWNSPFTWTVPVPYTWPSNY